MRFGAMTICQKDKKVVSFFGKVSFGGYPLWLGGKSREDELRDRGFASPPGSPLKLKFGKLPFGRLSQHQLRWMRQKFFNV
jgi:hypothetical protein